MNDDTDIPEFLLVKNRVPLTPEQKAALRKRRPRVSKAAPIITDRPRNWDAACQQLHDEIEADKKRKRDARFAALRARRESR